MTHLKYLECSSYTYPWRLWCPKKGRGLLDRKWIINELLNNSYLNKNLKTWCIWKLLYLLFNTGWNCHPWLPAIIVIRAKEINRITQDAQLWTVLHTCWILGVDGEWDRTPCLALGEMTVNREWQQRRFHWVTMCAVRPAPGLHLTL